MLPRNEIMTNESGWTRSKHAAVMYKGKVISLQARCGPQGG